MIRRILFALLATASIPAILGAQPAPAAATSPVPLIQLEHVSVLALGTQGKGAPVILIPGLSSPREVWDASVKPLLAAGHPVYLVQVNGFAGEDPRGNLAPGILAGIVADLHTLVVQHKLKNVAVVGHSLGGLSGLLWAKAHPADMAKLMVVDALPFYGTIFLREATVAMVEPRGAIIRDQLKASYGQPANAGAADGTAAMLALKPEARTLVSAWIRKADPRVSGQAMYEDLTTDLRGEMGAIATPITLVYPWSAEVPKERADALYRGEYSKAPNVTYVDIGDAAHFVMLDQPAAFAAALGAFVE